MTISWQELEDRRAMLIAVGRKRFSLKPWAAEDAASEAILKAFANQDKFDGTNLKAWLMTIHRNHVIHNARRDKRIALIEDIASVASTEHDYSMIEGIPGVENQEDIVRLKETLVAMDDLPDEQREAVVRAALGDGPQEIAEDVGVPWGTIKSRLSRGRAHLRAAAEGLPKPRRRRSR